MANAFWVQVSEQHLHPKAGVEGGCIPQCLEHHNPPPMENQKWRGQDSGLADLQEEIDTASCGEE